MLEIKTRFAAMTDRMSPSQNRKGRYECPARSKCIQPAWLTTPHYRVKGELSLRGVAADIDFNTTVAVIVDGSQVMEAHFDNDRTRGNVLYDGSTRFFEYLGIHPVFDVLGFQIRMVAMGP